jgi:uncharacterized protein (TIGR03382 family)
MNYRILACVLMVCATSAFGTLLITDPGTGVTTTFPAAPLVTNIPGPVVYGGFTITGHPTFSYGSSTSYGLGANGHWDLTNVATDSMTSIVEIDLGALYGVVGGFMNYDPGLGSDATIIALAADGTTVLASYDLETLAPISTPGATDGGAFRGIQLGTNNIRFLEFTGDFLLTHTLEVGSATPEPGTFGLAAIALAAAGLVGRRRRV